MRITILLIIASTVLLWLTSCMEEEIPYKSKYNRSQLIGKWRLDSVLIDGIKDTELKEGIPYFEFRNDSAFTYLDNGKNKRNYSWVLNTNSDAIELMNSNNSEIILIEDLETNKLVLDIVYKGTSLAYFSKVE